MSQRVRLAVVVLALLAPEARAVDADSLRLRRVAGGVELSWTDATPTAACVLRDPSPPPATLLAQAAGLVHVDAAPAVPILFYDVQEPAGGACTPAASCIVAGSLTCGAPLVSATTAAGSADVVDAWGGCPGPDASGREIAYSFVATQAGTHQATLSGAPAGLDVRVLSDGGAGCDPTRCIAVDDTSASWAATAGATYFIVVDGQAGATGSFNLTVTCPSLPTRCAPVSPIACGDVVSEDTAGPNATRDLNAHPACFAAGLDGAEILWSFAPAMADTVTVEILAGSGLLDIMVLHDLGGGCGTADCVAYGSTTTSFPAVAGQQYYVAVDGPAGSEGPVTVGMSCAASSCLPDAALLCGDYVSYNNGWPVFTDLNDTYPCSPHSYPGPEYVYRFIATGTGTSTATLSNTLADLDVLILDEMVGCSPATCVVWGDAGVTFPIVAGAAYQVVVDGRNGQQDFFDLQMTCAVPPTACSPDDSIACGELRGGDTANGHDLIDAWPSCAGWDESGPEYVFLHAPTDASVTRVVFDTTIGTQDLDLFILEDTGNGCDPAACIAAGDTEVAFTSVAGGLYFIVVDGRAGASDAFRILVECQPLPGACRSAGTIACGQTVSGRNDAPGSTDVIDAYPCLPWQEDGPEFAWSFVPTTTGDATARLSNMTASVDLFVLVDTGSGCDAGTCIAGASTVVTFPVTAGAQYSILVDGCGIL